MPEDYSALYYQCQSSIEQARLGWLYANGNLSPDEALTVMRVCMDIAGSYTLHSIDVDTIIESAGFSWSNSAEEIRPLAEMACARIYDKWPGSESVTEASEDWALNLIEEYAIDEGINLIKGEREGHDT